MRHRPHTVYNDVKRFGWTTQAYPPNVWQSGPFKQQDVWLPRGNVDIPESFDVHVRFFARGKEELKFEQSVCLIFELD